MLARAALVLWSLVLTALGGLAFAPASYDDGYITYRHADNLVHGRGFSFNPGEKVLGTSAPGYGLVLAGLTISLRSAGVAVDTVGAAIFLAGFALLPLLFCGMLRRLNLSRPELVAGAFALLAIPARWNAELMGCEQLPMLVLVALAFLLALDHRQVAAGACAGIAAAFRFDAGLAIAVLAIAIWIDRRRLPWRFTLAASVPVLACWSWLLATFGTILPITLAGKRSELEFVAAGYGTSELGWLVRTLGLPGACALVALVLSGLVGAASLRGRSRLFAAAAGGWLLAHELFYRLAGVPFAPWYHVAAINALLAVAAMGTIRALENWRHLAVAGSLTEPRHGRWTRVATSALAALAVGTVLYGSAEFYSQTWGRPPDSRIRIYRDVAAALRAHSAPGARVASVEIGALAFFADRPIVDLAGLLDPALRAAREEHRLAAALAAASPDYLVDNPAFHGNFLAQIVASGDLDKRYRVLHTFSRPEYPYPVRLLARTEAPFHDHIRRTVEPLEATLRRVVREELAERSK